MRTIYDTNKGLIGFRPSQPLLLALMRKRVKARISESKG